MTDDSHTLDDASHFRGLINADRPIQNIDEDLLSRKRFCKALADAISQWNGDESLVIGLNGPWGCGKSSIKNIVVSLLGERTPVVQFNPWTWSGEERLITAFFDEVGTVIPAASGGDSQEAMAKKWKLYSARLTLGGTALGHLRNAAEIAGIPWAPMILSSLASTARAGAGVAEQAADATDVTEVSVEQLKNDLVEAFKNLENPLLVVIDDVDRLTKEEIRLLFRIVKVNADFPNLVFLLLYDRDVIVSSLEEHVGGDSREYLEKIIQIGIDIPEPEPDSLDSVFTSGLESILGPVSKRSNFDKNRWQKLYAKGVRPFLASLRSIRRFLSGISFYMNVMRHDGELEANPIDLIGIELLRVFEPKLHRGIRENQSMVFGDLPTSASSNKEEREKRRELYRNWLAEASEKNRNAVEVLVKDLFPQLSVLMEEKPESDSSVKGEWLRGLRACHQDHFDRYFSLLLPSNEVSQTFINRLIAATSDRTEFCRALRSLDPTKRIDSALNRLGVHASSVPAENAPELVHALFDMGEELPHERILMYELSSDIAAWRIVREVLSKHFDASERSSIFLKCLEETDALWLPCRMVSIEQPGDGESLNPDEDIFNEVSLTRATQICLAKIRVAAISERIVGNRLGFYLWRWHQWGTADEPRAWVDGYIQDAHNAIAFLDSMTSLVSGISGRQKYEYREVELEWINAFVPPGRLMQKLEPFYGDVATEYQRDAREHSDILEMFSERLPDWEKQHGSSKHDEVQSEGK